MPVPHEIAAAICDAAFDFKAERLATLAGRDFCDARDMNAAQELSDAIYIEFGYTPGE